MKNRKAMIEWIGNLHDGGGQITSESGALTEKPFGFGSRFLDEPGTNPEELLAAAHASCFATHLAHLLAQHGTPPETMEIASSIKLDRIGDTRVEISGAQFEVTCSVANLDEKSYQPIIDETSKDCPMSRALNIKVRVSASLV